MSSRLQGFSIPHCKDETATKAVRCCLARPCALRPRPTCDGAAVLNAPYLSVAVYDVTYIVRYSTIQYANVWLHYFIYCP